MVMFKSGLPPAFPRMSQEDAAAAVIALSGKSSAELRAESSTSVDAARYYETAPARVDSSDLIDVQASIRRLAAAHGYPARQPRGGSLRFDQELTILLSDILNILPADAADEGVWSFLTLRVCPDVALWRFPNDENSEGNIRERYERLIGKPRNVFRRAWWRGYVLGKELSSQLLEDESVGIMERPSIGGNQRLARLVAEVQLEMVNAGGVRSRQELLREAIKRLRRQMGQISIHSLEDEGVASLVRDCFRAAAAALDYVVDGPQSLPLVANPLTIFQESAGPLWYLLDEFATEVPWETMDDLGIHLSGYRDDDAESHGAAAGIVRDLERLIDRWSELTAEGRAVVHATVAYFLLADDAIPDALPNGWEDDDRVVDAAYAALSMLRE